MAAPVTLDFDDVSLDDLRRRQSVKWRMYPPDVLPAFVAEMDFPLAEPIRAALIAAVENDDCGYPHPGGLGEAFAGFAAERWGWTVEPERVALVPDVVSGIAALLEVLTEPDAGVVVNPPVYGPFFTHGHGPRPADRRGRRCCSGESGVWQSRPRRPRARVRRRRRRCTCSATRTTRRVASTRARS